MKENTTALSCELDGEEILLPVSTMLPAAGDVGIVIDGNFYPVSTSIPSANSVCLTATAPVTYGKSLCLKVEPVHVLPEPNATIRALFCTTNLSTSYPQFAAQCLPVGFVGYTKTITSGQFWVKKDASGFYIQTSYSPTEIAAGTVWLGVYSSVEARFIADTPTEDDPNFEASDKDDPDYIPNPGLRFYSATHDEYDLTSVDYKQGVGYIYSYNNESAPTQALIDEASSRSAAYTAAQSATSAAYNKYVNGYTAQLPGVQSARQSAATAAYEATRADIYAAQAEWDAANNSLSEVQQQRSDACQAAYDAAAADMADQLAAAQAEESTAANAYYAADQAAYSAAQSAYDSTYQSTYSSTYQTAYDQAILDGYSAEDAASMASSQADSAGQEAGWNAWQTEYNSHQTEIMELYSAWMEKSQVTWALYDQQNQVAQAAYDAEYPNWDDEISTAQAVVDQKQAAYNAAVANWDQTAAQAAYQAAWDSYDSQIEAAEEHDSHIDAWKEADRLAWIAAGKIEAFALQYKTMSATAATDLGPHPDLRVPAISTLAPFNPPYANGNSFNGALPDYPKAAVGTVWNGKAFTPPELPGYSTTQPPKLRVRAYRYGRQLSDVTDIYLARVVGKIVVDYNADTRELTVTAPYTSSAKFSAVYTVGGNIFLDQQTPAKGTINTDGQVVISCTSDKTGFVKPIQLELFVIGENPTASFQKSFWTELPAVGNPTNQVAVILEPPFPDYYISASGSGDGLTPDHPASWDSLFTSTVLSNRFEKTVWLSGDPTTSKSTFELPYGVRIKGGFNSDFSGIVGRSKINKPFSRNKGGGDTAILEGLEATAGGIFIASNDPYGYGGFNYAPTYKNCALTFSSTAYPDGSNNNREFWNATNLYACEINIDMRVTRTYSTNSNASLDSPTYTWGSLGVGKIQVLGTVQNCTINLYGLSTFYCGGRILDSDVTAGGTDVFTIGRDNSSYTLTNRIERSKITIVGDDGAEGMDGVSGGYYHHGTVGGAGTAPSAYLYFGEVIDSELNVTLGKGGNGGNGGDATAGGQWDSGYGGAGGYGAPQNLYMPAHYRNCKVEVTVGEAGSGGSAGSCNSYTESQIWSNRQEQCVTDVDNDGEDETFQIRTYKPDWWKQWNYMTPGYGGAGTITKPLRWVDSTMNIQIGTQGKGYSNKNTGACLHNSFLTRYERLIGGHSSGYPAWGFEEMVYYVLAGSGTSSIVAATYWGSQGQNGSGGTGTLYGNAPYYKSDGAASSGSCGGNAAPMFGFTSAGSGGSGGQGATRPREIGHCNWNNTGTGLIVDQWITYKKGIDGLDGENGITIGDFLE